MLTTRKPVNAKLIIALIYSDKIDYDLIKTIITRKFGKIDLESEAIPFIYTQYYEPEMGKDLTRRFLSIEKLIPPEKIVKIKLWCIKVEKKFARNRQRTVNIDPGYITEAKLVLATTKDFSHRIYLDKGIYAEVTMNYQNKDFQNLPTTFPDYQTETYKAILRTIRAIYRKQIGK